MSLPLRLNFSLSNELKFWHNFNDTVDHMCTCDFEPEITLHYNLRCSSLISIPPKLKATINFLKIFERFNDALFDFESSVLFKTQKKYFVFESRLNFFFKWSYLQRCFNVAQRCEKRR